jgi:beta-N-acetylhexosaminidase
VCINAYESNGIATVLKHFPGNTNTDPHTGLPEIKWTQSEFDMQMASFKTLLEQKPAAILMSHARVKGYDEVLPACLSKYWVTDVLRNKFGYEGIIFSDDIFMGALADNGYPPEQAVVMAIEAGIDCIIISEKRIMDSVEVLIKKAQQNQAFNELLNKAVRRMIDYKIKAGMLYVHLDDSGKYVLSIDYEGCMNNDPSVFAGLKQQNRQFYMDNFYGK